VRVEALVFRCVDYVPSWVPSWVLASGPLGPEWFFAVFDEVLSFER
jgi:hypothetical protein